MIQGVIQRLSIVQQSDLRLMLREYPLLDWGIAFALCMLALALFVGYRMSVRPAIPAQAQGPFIVLPDTSTATAASLNPETEWIDNSPEAKAELDPLEDNPYFPSELR